MTDDSFESALKNIRDNFKVEEEFEGEIENIPGATFRGIVFFAPLGKFKVVRSLRPRVVGHSQGLDFDYSKSDFIDDVEVSKWSERLEDWERASLESLMQK
jgi:hypothetical protein